MSRAFITGFYDEITKTASHPLFQTVAGGGTLLGQKVKGAIGRTVKRSQKISNRAARGAGLKGVVEKKAGEKRAFFEPDDEDEGDDLDADEGGGAEEAGEMLRRIMAQHQQDYGYQEEPAAGADAPLYGSGGGKPRKPNPPRPPAKKPAGRIGSLG